MANHERRFGSWAVLSLVLSFLSGAAGAQAACLNGIQGTYNNGDTVTVNATPTAADGISATDSWAVCIYSGGKLNGGENLPLGRSTSGPGASKTASATVNTATDYTGWRAVIYRNNGCNSTYTAGGLCEASINAAGTAYTGDTGDGGGDDNGDGGGDDNGGGGGNTGGNATSYTTGDKTRVSFPSFFTGISTFTELMQAVLSWILSVAGGVALLFIIYGGILYIASTGDPKKAEQGKHIVTWTVLGLLVLLFSYSIVAVVDDIFAR